MASVECVSIFKDHEVGTFGMQADVTRPERLRDTV